jgi:hypothetical protein
MRNFRTPPISEGLHAVTRCPRIVTYAASLVLLTELAQSTPANAQTGVETSGSMLAHGSPDPARADGADAVSGLGAAFTQAFGFTVFQHVVRLNEEKTRRELGGAFLGDWFKSVSNAGRNWDDGGKFFTNYVAHPQGGAVYAHIYRQNNQDRKHLEIGEPGYGGMVARAMLFSAVVGAQFELGPVSEASIGNVGMHDASKMAWVDLVITPTLGTAWMVGEDLIDEQLLTRMDGANTVLRNTLRFLLNPSRGGANLARLKWPWFRERDVERRRYGLAPAVP